MKKWLIFWAVALCLCQFGLGSCSAAFAQPIWEAAAYDVIVIGGEPEGVAAAVSAARNGLSTLLVEDGEALGGLMTLGMLNTIDMCVGGDNTLVTQGIFKEFYDAVGGNAFDIEQAKAVFMNMAMQEPLLELKLQTQTIAPVVEGNSVLGVTLLENGQEKSYRSARVIDATADADIAAAAGVPYTFGQEDIGEKDKLMGVTLIFAVRGVDWDSVEDYLKNDGDNVTGINGNSAWGYGKEAFRYQPQDEEMLLRGFNMGRQANGDVLINALVILGVDVLDERSKAEGIARAQAELVYLLPFIQENFRGFESCSLAGTATQLYVRESRHIIGEYQLTIDDVLGNRNQWDKIAVGSYPVDVQSSTTSSHGVVLGNPDRYAIPFRCLVPLNIDNLLVVGRAASYTSLAAGSARVIPVGMAEGEAAGVATAYSIRHQIGYREMTADRAAIEAVQQQLKNQGAYLDDFNINENIANHWAYTGVKTLRALGVFAAGYDNDYHLAEVISKKRFQNLFKGVMKGLDWPLIDIEIDENPCNGEIIAAVCQALNFAAADYNAQLAYLQRIGVIDGQIRPYFANSAQKPQSAEVIMLLANLYNTEMNKIKVYFNGQLLSFSRDPYIDNDVTLVPMRAIFEAFDADVRYEEGSKKVTVAKGGNVIELAAGQQTAVKNGETIWLDAAAVNIDGVVMAPLRFVAEALQASVEWDSANRTITIITN